MTDYYSWVLVLHVLSLIAWMAGMFYLPRLYVYHADAKQGSELSETFKIMERRLLRGIINPAMIATWLFGLWLLALQPGWLEQGWLHLKLAAVVALTVMHVFFARWRKDFEGDRNARPARFYRIANEVPTVLLIIIVISVIVKPF
ncbi:protoporphyrinogen oxidase HemJ [Fodinicurvata sp. EGI_FJ10296]|uniref:protoporphyrinogen oxidase HemJ n=1 Tax=Fodinicurvata sp. EGI_FJ10296 TaxID=3231908 RepID=UPI00345225DF